MSPQCSTKRSAASGSFSEVSAISVMTEISKAAEGKSSAKAACDKTIDVTGTYRGSRLAAVGAPLRPDRSRAGHPRPRAEPHAGGQGFLQHHHLAHGLGGDEPDEAAAAVDHRAGR